LNFEGARGRKGERERGREGDVVMSYNIAVKY